MKALSIRAPWWLAILEWGKRAENRFWKAPLAYRGPLLIHASAWWDDDDVEEDYMACKRARAALLTRGDDIQPAPRRSWEYVKSHRGGIVGIAQLTDCRWALEPRFRATGALGIVLADPRPLPFVPLKGALGLFEVTPETVLSDPCRVTDGPEHRVAVESLIKLLSECPCGWDVEEPGPHIATCPWRDPSFEGVSP